MLLEEGGEQIVSNDRTQGRAGFALRRKKKAIQLEPSNGQTEDKIF